MHAWSCNFFIVFMFQSALIFKGSMIISTAHEEEYNHRELTAVMEGGSSQDCSGPTKPMSELEALQKQHDEKLLRIQELKGKKEAMMVELEEKKNENPKKMKGFDDLSERYNSRRDQFFALLAEKSQKSEK